MIHLPSAHYPLLCLLSCLLGSKCHPFSLSSDVPFLDLLGIGSKEPMQQLTVHSKATVGARIVKTISTTNDASYSNSSFQLNLKSHSLNYPPKLDSELFLTDWQIWRLFCWRTTSLADANTTSIVALGYSSAI